MLAFSSVRRNRRVREGGVPSLPFGPVVGQKGEIIKIFAIIKMGQKNSREGEFSPEGERGLHGPYAGRKSVTSDKRKKPTHKRTGSMGNNTISRFSDLTGIQLNNNMVGTQRRSRDRLSDERRAARRQPRRARLLHDMSRVQYEGSGHWSRKKNKVNLRHFPLLSLCLTDALAAIPRSLSKRNVRLTTGSPST